MFASDLDLSRASDLTSNVTFESQCLHEELWSGPCVFKTDSFNTSFSNDVVEIIDGTIQVYQEMHKAGTSMEFMNVLRGMGEPKV